MNFRAITACFVTCISVVLFLSGCQLTQGNLVKQQVESLPSVSTEFKQPIVMIHPKYPIDAARIKQDGWVHMVFDINEKGRVKNLRVIKTSPADFGFENEATRALAKWRYKPLSKSGKPEYQSAQEIVLEFRIDN